MDMKADREVTLLTIFIYKNKHPIFQAGLRAKRRPPLLPPTLQIRGETYQLLGLLTEKSCALDALTKFSYPIEIKFLRYKLQLTTIVNSKNQ